MEKIKNRESGIELLKILAIFLIIISHVVQSFSNANQFILNNTTLDFKYIIIMLMRHLGVLGNLIFIICTSWFLIGNKKDNKRKIFKLIIEIFVISIIILSIFLLFGVNIAKKDIIKSCFPTLFANNWYTTCYILFLMMVPFLNIILEKIEKKQLLRICIVFLLLYWIISVIINVFFINDLILFITIFFIIAYIKKYCDKFVINRSRNVILLIFSIVVFIILILATNMLGSKIPFFSKKALYWNKNNNIILLLCAIAFFNLFKSFKFKNKIFNYISSLTLYIYIIHENLLVRGYLRIDIWKWIGEKFTYNNIIIETIIYAILLFIISLILSILYKYTIKKIIDYVVEKLYNGKLNELYKKFENKLLEIK